MTSFRALVIRYSVLAGIVPILVLTIFLLHDQETRAREALDRSLLVTATSVSRMAPGLADPDLQSRVQDLGKRLGVRLTVIREDGRVLADSEADPAHMENHANRPEVVSALSEGTGTTDRFSATLREEMHYLALATDGAPGARLVYRAAEPLTLVHAQLRRTQFALLLTCLGVVALSLLLFTRLGQQVAHPVDALSNAAARFSQGQGNVHVIPDGPESLRRLGETFNSMVDRLSSQVRRLAEAQGYLDAVVRQMPEGLLVLDRRGLVTQANAAAEELLRVPAHRLLGRPILSVIMSYALDREVKRALEGELTDERAPFVEHRGAGGQTLRVAVGPLRVDGSDSTPAEPHVAGAVVILQDVSELRRADAMRRDFVANVSHELRTPVAAIRAMVETLMLRGAKRPELLQDYGARMVGECERIDHLVRDLLLLAETESGHLRLALEEVDPGDLAAGIVQQVGPLAAAADTRLELGAFPQVRILADQFAAGQCLRNLVDNAVRHAAGGCVQVGGEVRGRELVFSVADDGPGIPAEDLPRIFERFYRVDKARTREKGGSGLGLAIVKHMAEVQGGRAWAESQVDAGSTFYLAFPLTASGVSETPRASRSDP